MYLLFCQSIVSRTPDGISRNHPGRRDLEGREDGAGRGGAGRGERRVSAERKGREFSAHQSSKAQVGSEVTRMPIMPRAIIRTITRLLPTAARLLAAPGLHWDLCRPVPPRAAPRRPAPPRAALRSPAQPCAALRGRARASPAWNV